MNNLKEEILTKLAKELHYPKNDMRKVTSFEDYKKEMKYSSAHLWSCQKIERAVDLALESEQERLKKVIKEIQATEKCMVFTLCQYPCENKDCKRREYCPLAYGGSFKRLLEQQGDDR